MKSTSLLLCSATVILLSASCNSCKEEEPQPAPKPVAYFRIPAGNSLYAGCTAVEFINESKNAQSYRWSFGDGSAFSNEVNPTHVFSTPGTYTVHLTATSTTTETHDTSFNVTVSLNRKYYHYFPSQTDDEEYFKKVLKTSDGGYLCMGVSKGFNISQDNIWLVKTTAGGLIFWEKGYKGLNIAVANDVIAISGGYLIAGYTKTVMSDNNWKAYVIQVNETGDLVASYTYDKADKSYFSNIFLSTDGGYILAGAATDAVSGEEKPAVFRLTANLKLSQETIYSGIPGAPFIKDGILGTDGSMVMAGNVLQNGHYDAFALKINPAGAVLWVKTYGTSTFDGFNTAVELPGGKYAFGGTATNAFSLPQGWVCLVDPNGIKEKDVILDGDEIHDLIRDKNGGLVGTGFGGVVNNAGMDDIYLFKLDPAGKILWETSFAGKSNTYEVGYGILEESDGRLVIAGGSGLTYKQDGVLIKTECGLQ